MVKPSPDRSAIVRLHKAGRPPATIAKHLGIRRSVVYRTLQRYRNLDGIQDRRRSGRNRTARTPMVVEVVIKRIARNATRSISTIARDMGISRKSMEGVVHGDLKMYPYRTREAAIFSSSVSGSAGASQKVPTPFASDAQQGPPFDRLFE
ncbi:unnamed protein product [Haemonchus placei]|uniref:Helix-turn-helix domain-containing protein n=1 Tax=Haemonchus placei TaxID=6290 RepID=A0A0N4WRB8_HAEPC|nr:unnamed protein product [Haemonchus placei]